MGRSVVGPVAVPGDDPSIDVVVHYLRGQRLERHLDLGGIDELALPGAAPMVHGRHDGRREHPGGDDIGQGSKWAVGGQVEPAGDLVERSEERRVGKECRSRWSPYH